MYSQVQRARFHSRRFQNRNFNQLWREQPPGLCVLFEFIVTAHRHAAPPFSTSLGHAHHRSPPVLSPSPLVNTRQQQANKLPLHLFHEPPDLIRFSSFSPVLGQSALETVENSFPPAVGRRLSSVRKIITPSSHIRGNQCFPFVEDHLYCNPPYRPRRCQLGPSSVHVPIPSTLAGKPFPLSAGGGVGGGQQPLRT